MAVLTGKRLSVITFEHFVEGFNATELTLPNTSGTNFGEFGLSDKLIEIHLNGINEYKVMDFTISRVTAHAHKVLFVDENGDALAHEGDLKIKWQLG